MMRLIRTTVIAITAAFFAAQSMGPAAYAELTAAEKTELASLTKDLKDLEQKIDRFSSIQDEMEKSIRQARIWARRHP